MCRQKVFQHTACIFNVQAACERPCAEAREERGNGWRHAHAQAHRARMALSVHVYMRMWVRVCVIPTFVASNLHIQKAGVTRGGKGRREKNK